MVAKVVINRDGARAVRCAPGVLADLERRARAIAAAAGPGMVVRTSVGPNRARAAVITATLRARRGQAKDKRLTRAIDAGR